MTNKILLVALVFFLVSSQLMGSENEVIRRKVENAATSPLTAFGEIINCSNSIQVFYQNRLFEAAWNSETTSQLISILQTSDHEGLRPNDYHTEKLLTLVNAPPKTDFAKAEYDLLLSDAFLLYTSHLLQGKVNPQTINAEWHVVRREGNPVELLNDVIASGNVNKAIQDVIPKHIVYQNLKKTLEIYRNIKVAWPVIPSGITIKKEMEDERIPAIRQRLFVLGDLKDKRADNQKLYDDNLFTAIQHFQKRHGIDGDGNIGAKTISALNISIEQRILNIEANMERWRWLPQEFGNYYLIVNIANFELTVIKNDELVRSRKIIVGKPYRRTPVFSSKMQYLVLNPTWTIPPGILNADVLPGVRKDPLYLEKKKLMVLDSQGNLVNTSEIDWNSKAVKSYTYRQPAGPDNALGAVKFMFPNSFHVYLHDTPSKEMFDQTERAFSSGCIRVQDPLSLAEFFLDDPTNWSREKINKIVATKMTQTVQLKEQPNVYLLYWTAWTEDNGVVHFRKDIYERNMPLIEQLKASR
jgi:murein L,D-transpeptidase YcbB/YkuD